VRMPWVDDVLRRRKEGFIGKNSVHRIGR
jgi:hypothetical protein